MRSLIGVKGVMKTLTVPNRGGAEELYQCVDMHVCRYFFLFFFDCVYPISSRRSVLGYIQRSMLASVSSLGCTKLVRHMHQARQAYRLHSRPAVDTATYSVGRSDI